MATIMKLTLKNAIRDPYLLFWSLIVPIGGTIGFGYFIGSVEYTQRILTGMMCTSVIFYAYMTTVFTNIAQRRRGVYSLLQITPLSLGKYIISISFAWTIIATICFCVVLVSGIMIFNIKFSLQGILWSVLITMFAANGYIFLSFFISAFCKNEGQASMISNLIAMPMLFCSDAFYSLQKAPEIIQQLSKFNIFQYFVHGVRAALNGDVKDYILCGVVLIILFLIELPLAIKTFKFSA